MESNNDNQEKMDQQKTHRPLFSTIAIVFIAAVLGLSFAGIIKPDVKYSEEENRVLTE